MTASTGLDSGFGSYFASATAIAMADWCTDEGGDFGLNGFSTIAVAGGSGGRGFMGVCSFGTKSSEKSSEQANSLDNSAKKESVIAGVGEAGFFGELGAAKVEERDLKLSRGLGLAALDVRVGESGASWKHGADGELGERTSRVSGSCNCSSCSFCLTKSTF